MKSLVFERNKIWYHIFFFLSSCFVWHLKSSPGLQWLLTNKRKGKQQKNRIIFFVWLMEFSFTALQTHASRKVKTHLTRLVDKKTSETKTFPSCSVLWRQSISWFWRSDFSSLRSFRRCRRVSCREKLYVTFNITQCVRAVSALAKDVCTSRRWQRLQGLGNNRRAAKCLKIRWG